jgi:hypothetical protein
MGLKEKNALMAAAVAALVAGAPLAGGCKSNKSESSASCCASVAKHSCKGMIACKGQGGCSTGDNGCAAKNSCKGHGGCAVPIKH